MVASRTPARPFAPAIAALALALLPGCISLPESPGEEQPFEVVMPPPARTDPVPDFAQPAQAWFDRTLNLSSYDEATLDAIAACPVAVFQAPLLLSPEGASTIARVRERNPDIVVIGILNCLSRKSLWTDPGQRARFPLFVELDAAWPDRPVYSTTGVEVLMWNGAPMLNPRNRAGEVDLAQLNRHVNAVCRVASDYPGVMDGIFHDYLSPSPYMFPGQQGEGAGEPDLDRDGIAARDDEDDQAVWQGWQRALVQEFQRRFGAGFIQVANGNLHHERNDATFGSLLAGGAYEGFPNTVWGYTDGAGMDLVSGHAAPGYLTPRRGQVFNLLWDHTGRNPAFCRTASAITGQLYCLSDTAGDGPGADSQRVPAGEALGPPLREELPGGGVRWSRSFEGYRALIEVDASGETVRNELQGL